MSKNAKSLITALIVLFGIAILAHPFVAGVGNVSLLDQATPMRFAAAAIAALLAFILFYASSDSPAWNLNTQQTVYAVIGAVLAGVVRLFFNGNAFVLPAFEQVTLQPALVVPVLVGVVLGPTAGFIAGAGGSLLANLFDGWVLPHVDFAFGLAGLVAGLTQVWTDTRRRHVVVAVVAFVFALATTGFYYSVKDIPVSAPPGSLGQEPTLLLGVAALVGTAIAIAVRNAFPNRPRWGYVSIWGVLGVFAGHAYLAIGLLMTEGLSFNTTFATEYLAVIGASVLAVVLFVPALLAISEWFAALPDEAEPDSA